MEGSLTESPINQFTGGEVSKDFRNPGQTSNMFFMPTKENCNLGQAKLKQLSKIKSFIPNRIIYSKPNLISNHLSQIKSDV